MLFHLRERQRELDSAEAEGETFWTAELPRDARFRLLYIYEDLAAAVEETTGYTTIAEHIRNLVVRDAGLPSLAGEYYPDADVAKCFRQAQPSIVFSVVEGAMIICKALIESGYDRVADSLESFANKTSMVLRQHRVSFELVDHRLVALESCEMHSEVVAPALRLLGRDELYREVETSYQEALEEISNGTPDDAITDAARALEQMLQALGCSGNTLGKQLADARERGLLGEHDTQLREAILKVGSWVAADRASKGDAHPGGSATFDDAWLIVHIVGALILRLSRSPSRGDSD